MTRWYGFIFCSITPSPKKFNIRLSAEVTTLARPKSVNLASLLVLMRMFSGFTSRYLAEKTACKNQASWTLRNLKDVTLSQQNSPEQFLTKKPWQKRHQTKILLARPNRCKTTPGPVILGRLSAHDVVLVQVSQGQHDLPHVQGDSLGLKTQVPGTEGSVFLLFLPGF